MGHNDVEYFSSTPRGDVIHDLVVFEDVQIIYDKKEKIFADFFIDPKFKASTRDWIGIYSSGWSSFESFVAYKWGIGDRINDSLRHRRVVFEPIDFSSIEPDRHYQFVYVGQDLEIMGVSQFFRFSSQPEVEVSKIPFKIASEESNLVDKMYVPEELEKNYSLQLPHITNDMETIIPNNELCELKQKLEFYDRKNRELEDRVVKLENEIESLKSSNALLNVFNEKLERNFFNFIRKQYHNLINCGGDNGNPVENDRVNQVYQPSQICAILGDQEIIGLGQVQLTELLEHKFSKSLRLCKVKIENIEEEFVPDVCRVAEENVD